MSKKIFKIVNTILLFFFLTIGALSSIVLLHEFYHILTIEGTPTGICLGKCYIEDSSKEFAPAGISYILDSNQRMVLLENHKLNEREAWYFGIIIIIILVLLLVYTEYKR